MGKTVESYRMALDGEITRWSNFARALRASDREAFERLMDACRSYASAAGNATQPVLFEPMALSIMLYQETQIMKLEKKLDSLNQQHAGSEQA